MDVSSQLHAPAAHRIGGGMDVLENSKKLAPARNQTTIPFAVQLVA